jgi:hypothetical protein
VSRSLRRGTLAASALVFSLATLSACGAGNNAQTLSVKPDSAATTIDKISIQNATVVTQAGSGSDGIAAVTGTVFNSGRSAQTLDSIALPGTDAKVRLAAAGDGSGPITVPGGGSVQLGGKGHASALIENGGEAGKDGDAQTVVFTFSKTGDVGLRALVIPADSFRAGIGPTAPPAPSVSPSDTPSGSSSGNPGGTPTDGTSGTPGTPGGSGSTDATGSTGSSGLPSDSASASANTTG